MWLYIKLRSVGVIQGLKAFVEQGYTDMKLFIDEHGHLGNDLIYERGHTQWIKDGTILDNK